MSTPSHSHLYSLSISHHSTSLLTIGGFLIDDRQKVNTLQTFKEQYALEELYYLSTCNRLELVMVTSQSELDVHRALSMLQSLWQGKDSEFAITPIQIMLFQGEQAVNHLMRTACSLESMLIGEQEILTQIRKATDFCRENKLSGDSIRLTMKKVIETGKRCYAETRISANPVSVAYLAWERLRSRNLNTDSRILLVGAGQMITSFSKFLRKAGYSNVIVASRTRENAQLVARTFGTQAMTIAELSDYRDGFDVLVSCTAAADHVIDKTTYAKLCQNDDSQKVLVDLALPFDIDQEIISTFNVDYVNMHSIQQTVDENIALRKMEIGACETIIEEALAEYHVMVKQREIERAMSTIPMAVKEIRSSAMNHVFSAEIAALDEQSRETLDRVLEFMEKKFISVPMKMAREVMSEAISTR